MISFQLNGWQRAVAVFGAVCLLADALNQWNERESWTIRFFLGITLGIVAFSDVNFNLPGHRRRVALRALESVIGNFQTQAAWPEMHNMVRRAISAARPESLSAFEEFGDTARNAIVLMIYRLSVEAVTSGRMHIYRGKLSLNGVRMRALAHFALDHAIAIGVIPKREGEAERETIAEMIEQAG